ncbi:hypothetical protein A8F94_05200 [Bacillus sp. FJAT-27225]|uniref:PilN domain-containing protein n=1 Tax=Bacillus sp. FJAT-27225 TaxID=1743144 RepID=UPI00080C2F68|nr:PilN domain-containing protein [Bacillus sp. FJAT-27225]OCA91258.1 hypothetical protein A8F94_05200 [Bacillus sp. FJAT-27225]
MLIDINLLPKKKRKSGSLVAVSLIFTVLFFAAGGFLYWQSSSLKIDIAAVDNRLETTKKLQEIEEKKATEVTAADSVAKLEQSVTWAEDYAIPSVPVMKEFTSLLPERGFIQTFAYQETGVVTLSVQFDTTREAAYFLNRLNGSGWVTEATLSSLAATQTVGEQQTAESTTVNVNNEKKKDILPRYQGQFEIKLNKDSVKAAILEQEEGESGL